MSSLVERIQFSSERDAVLARRDSLALGMGAEAAHAWIRTGLWALVHDAPRCADRFATREWAQRVPWFMLDAPLCDIVASLPAGKTLCDAHPQAFAAPAPAATVCAISCPFGFPFHRSRTPSRSVPYSPVPSAAPSPTLPVRLAPLSLACRGLAGAGGLSSPVDPVSSGPPSAGSGTDVTPLASSLPAPSLSVGGTRPRRVGSSAPAVAVAGRIAPCERCRDKKKGCVAAVADDPRGPCALCVKTGVTCIRGRGIAAPRAAPLPSAPPLVSFENYLVGIPAVPVHGTTTARSIVAAQTEYLYADAALTAAMIAEARRDEAGKRCHLAWSTYTGWSATFVLRLWRRRLGLVLLGKDEVIDLEESDLGSGVEDGDVEMQ
ncbi:hypothetical protein BJV77DRAFT_1056834 [Russula vinacea]|nr:hypothetical protein BJV77DRAFT_1056834 [Russula vinacea]